MPKMTVAQKREFLVEMCNCREYLKTDVELNKAVLKKHLKFLPQQKLYKFRVCIEREFRMLEENCIWMSLASSFPDPFDHTINIDLVKNRREVKEWLGKNGSSLCFEVVKRLFEEKGLAIPYTFSDFEDYMKTCLDENGIPIKDRERAFLAAHATPDELSQMDSIIQQLVCAKKRFAGIDRSRVQFILTTASMPNKNEADRRVIQTFANDLTASDDGHEFHYLAGQQEEIGSGRAYDIPFDRFTKAHPESFEGDNAERLLVLNKFWEGIIDSPAPFSTDNSAYQWLYDHLADYVPFRELFKLCRGTTASLQELAQSIFPSAELEDAFHAVGVMLAIAPLARSGSGSVLFPARMHMLFRGIKGVYACTNPECSCAHTENGLTLGEVYFTDGNLTCKKCGSTVYELYNDRRCGSIFFRGFVLKQDFDDRKRTYLWHYPGMMNENEVQEIHLFVPSADYQLPEKQGKNKIQPCYLDVCSGFVDFSDDSLDGSPGIRKLYYGEFTTKARPDILTFSTCPHCRHELGKRQLTSFSTRGNQSFFNLIKAQFAAQPAVPEKVGEPDRLPNEGRKILLFSDSRQRAAKLARDMSDASDATVARQLAAIAIDRMEHEVSEQSMNYIYDYFAMVAVEHHVQIFHDSENEKQRERLVEHGSIASKNYKRAKSRRQEYHPRFSIDNALKTIVGGL